MTILVTPYPISAEGHAGLQASFFSEQSPRRAVLDHAHELGRGWFTIEEGANHRGQTLWRVRWVLPKQNHSSGNGRMTSTRLCREYRYITEPVRRDEQAFKARWMSQSQVRAA